jgi:putative phage-type endonuclease
MTRRIRIESPAHWHQLRAQHIGGSETAALFGEHPQLTRYELWHIKAGLLPAPNLSDNDRVFWGTVLEPAIAGGVAARTGWRVRKVRSYFSCLPDLALGASLDYEIVAHDRGPGVLEIKTADWLVAKEWGGEPPLSYELQLQSYMGCTGRPWGVMAVLVGGNDLRLFEYERRPKTVALIREAAGRFWQSIAAGVPPQPDFEQDGAAISKLYGNAAAGKITDLTGHNRLADLVLEYRAASAEEAEGKRIRERARAEILMLAGDAETVLCGEWRLSLGAVAAAPDRIIGPEMVGEVLPGRSGYRSLRITQRKDRGDMAA